MERRLIEGLRIGLDGRVLYSSPQRGMARYTYNLVKALAQIAPENEYRVYSDAQLPVGFAGDSGITVRLLDRKQLWSNTSLAAAAQADRLDVMHFPSNTCWARRVCPTVVTLHDVNPLLDHRYGWRNRLLYIGYLLAMTLTTQAIITDSHASRQAIARACPALAGRTFVIHLGVSEPFLSASETRHPPSGQVQQPYLLFIGGCDPHKNLLGLVRALGHATLKHQTRVRLVVVGACPDTGYASDVKATIDRLGLAERIQWRGMVSSDEDLVSLYRGAAAFVYPSFREGFGLPVLEAMACGTPVIATRAASVPELAGEAALLVDPADSGALAGAIAQLLTDPELAGDLRRRGRERVRRFSWERTAQQSLDVYRSIAGAI